MRVRCSGQQEAIPVRLAHIDAPELHQEHGKRSRDFLRFICPVGMKVQVQSSGKDRRGRMLGTVICNDINANVAMIMGGHAWASGQPVPAAELEKIQKKAQSNHMGLWRRPNPIDPREFRKMVR